MAVPERYLDERQKMVRDQAHRSAFRLVKLICCLIPLLLLAQYFLPRQPTPAPVSTATVMVAAVQPVIWYTEWIPNPGRVQPLRLVQVTQTANYKHPMPVILQWFPSVHVKPISPLTVHQLITRTPPTTPISPISTASTAEIALAVGILLLCLYVLFSALPMSVIAWKKRL